MKQTQYAPAPQQKRGCSAPLAWLVIVITFVGIIFAPQMRQMKTLPILPEVFQRVQHLLPGTSTPIPPKKSPTSMKLSAPSGACFDLARTAARQAGIDPTLYTRQINQESGCQASVCSSAGACGVAQLMPEMAAAFHVDPMNVSQSLATGAHLMAGYLKTYQGSWALALACYNAGSGATAYALKTYGQNWLAHMPIETQNYVYNITGGQA